MIEIKEVSEKFSSNIARELNLDDEKRDIINYGIFNFIQTGICLALVIIFGFIFNVIIEALIIAFTISILRKSSGGVHAPTPESCAIVGTVASVGMAVIGKNIDINLLLVLLFGIIVFIWSFYIIYKLAPIDSAAKPIKSAEKRAKLKLISIKVLCLYLIIVIISVICYLITQNAIALSYSICIYMGLLWQVFSLTKSGHVVFGKLNELFQ